jgi:hypothetical protein
MDFIKNIEKALGKKAKIKHLPLQLGDLPETYADLKDLDENFGYNCPTTIEIGIQKFISWYLDYHNEKNKSHLN